MRRRLTAKRLAASIRRMPHVSSFLKFEFHHNRGCRDPDQREGHKQASEWRKARVPGRPVPLRRVVPAAHHRDNFAIRQNLRLMKQHGRRGHRTARLSRYSRGLQRPHRTTNLIVGDSNNLVNESSEREKIQLAQTLRPQSVAHCPRSKLRRPGHQRARSQSSPAHRQPAPALRLSRAPPVSRASPPPPHRSTIPRRSPEPAPGPRPQALPAISSPHGALPGDNLRIVIRRNNHIPKLSRQLFSLQSALATRGSHQNNLRAQSRRSRALHFRSI